MSNNEKMIDQVIKKIVKIQDELLGEEISVPSVDDVKKALIEKYDWDSKNGSWETPTKITVDLGFDGSSLKTVRLVSAIARNDFKRRPSRAGGKRLIFMPKLL